MKNLINWLEQNYQLNIHLNESGLDRFIHPNKGNFIGLEALNKWREKGFENKLVTMEIHNVDDADVLGNNPIYDNDKVVGRATGGDFGFRLGKSIASRNGKTQMLRQQVKN